MTKHNPVDHRARAKAPRGGWVDGSDGMPYAHAAASTRAAATLLGKGAATAANRCMATIRVTAYALYLSPAIEFDDATEPSVQYKRSQHDGLMSSAVMQCDLVRHGTFKGQLGRRACPPVRMTARVGSMHSRVGAAPTRAVEVGVTCFTGGQQYHHRPRGRSAWRGR